MRRRGSFIYTCMHRRATVFGACHKGRTMNLVGLFAYARARARAGVQLYFKFKFAATLYHVYLAL